MRILIYFNLISQNPGRYPSLYAFTVESAPYLGKTTCSWILQFKHFPNYRKTIELVALIELLSVTVTLNFEISMIPSNRIQNRHNKCYQTNQMLPYSWRKFLRYFFLTLLLCTVTLFAGRQTTKNYSTYSLAKQCKI